MPSISIVGIGRVGGALAIALSRAGFTIDSLIHRDPTVTDLIRSYLPPEVKTSPLAHAGNIPSDVILITTADPDIKPTASELDDRISSHAIVLHTSGSLSSKVLDELRTSDRRIGSLHPLVSISDPIRGADKFGGIYFCVEGDRDAVKVGNEIVDSLGARTFSIAPEQKALYHAAAVTAAGQVTSLIDIAISMLAATGVDRETAKEVLLPLVESTVANLKTQTPQEALTGSFARADAAAIERHLESFKGPLAERVRDIYLLLGEHSLDLAESNGADPSAVRRIREVISVAKRKSGC